MATATGATPTTAAAFLASPRSSPAPSTVRMGETERGIWEEMTTNCTTYVFPPNQRHPLSGPRLYAYARYGPAVTTKMGITLSGAHHPMLPHEHRLTLQQQVREMLGDAYVCRKQLLTDEDVEALMEGRHDLFDSSLVVTPNELRDVLNSARRHAKPVPSNRASDTKAIRNKVFTEISEAIYGFRTSKVKALQTATPEPTQVIKDVTKTKRKTMFLYNQPRPKAYTMDSWESPIDVSRALHRTTCAISTMEAASSPQVTQNMRCLRPEIEYDGTKEAWDSYCCLRNTTKKKWK
eukprot:PhM_4_TR13858/c0_g1_i1/m.26332